MENITDQHINKLVNCLICCNLADKTNTHLIPWFIIKHHITQAGSGERDKEVSFTISSRHFTKLYAGRSVLPETLEEFGELDKLEKEYESPYSRDNLWCSQCEAKFSRLEAVFSASFKENKMRHLYWGLPVQNQQRLMIESGLNFSVFQIFVHSIFWRCSVGKLNGFQLHPVVEKEIRENLKEAFTSHEFHKLQPRAQLPVLHVFPIIASLLFSKEGDDPTENLITINKVRIPYFIMAGKWLFQLFEKEDQIRTSQEWLFGLRQGLDTQRLYTSIKSKPHVVLLNDQLSSDFKKNQLKDFVYKKLRGLQRDIRLCYFHFFKHKPSMFIQDYIQQRYFVHLDSGKADFQSFVHAFNDLKKLPRRTYL